MCSASHFDAHTGSGVSEFPPAVPPNLTFDEIQPDSDGLVQSRAVEGPTTAEKLHGEFCGKAWVSQVEYGPFAEWANSLRKRGKQREQTTVRSISLLPKHRLTTPTIRAS